MSNFRQQVALGNNFEGRFTEPGLACFAGSGLYERFYCARGNMENRIKEQQMDLFADRTSTAWQSSNQLRLRFSTLAYLLLSQLRTVALHGTSLAAATMGTIRLKLVKSRC